MTQAKLNEARSTFVCTTFNFIIVTNLLFLMRYQKLYSIKLILFWGMYFKTYSGFNLWIFVLRKSACPWQVFPG
jgi:hypothetical protein